MRPPQSIICRLSFFRTIQVLTICFTILLFGLMPQIAAAATPQFTAAPTGGLHFRGVDLGQTETLIATVSNNGPSSVAILAIKSSNPAFTPSAVNLPLALAVGQSFDVSVSFTPTTLGWTSGVIQFSTGASATLALNVDGGGEKSQALSVAPSSISFGQVAVGSSSTKPVVLTNARSWSVTIPAIQMMGNGFSMSGTAFPMTLSAGQSVTVNVIFAPQSTGLVGGSVAFLGPWIAVPLTGTGITTVAGQLSVAPAPLSFGSVPVGTTTTQSITVSATGASVTVSSAASSSSQFILSGASFPFTIAAGQEVSFNVGFTPKSSGSQAGSLSFVSNASTAQTVESLSGTGTVTAYSVNLWWNSSSDVVGYNVYRSMAANGTYTKINPALNSATAFTDNTVASGNTYYYAATSVNSAGMESARSSPVQTTIP